MLGFAAVPRIQVMTAAAEQGTRGRRAAPISLYDALALLLIVALTSVTALSFTRPGNLLLVHSAALQNTILTTALLVGLGATYVALGEFLLYGRLSSLCICLAFLVFLAADATMGLLPILAGWDHRLAWLPYGSAVHQVVGGGFLLAAGLLVDRNISVARRVRTAAVGIGTAILLGMVVAAWVYVLQTRGIPASGQAVPQIIAGALFFVSSALFYRVSREYRRTWFLWLALSLVIAGFAQLQFALHQYPARVVQAGDILRLLFFMGILIWLAADWSQNYRRLRWQARQLEALHRLMTAPDVRNVAEVQAHIERVAGETLQGTASVLVAGRGGRSQQDALRAHMIDLASTGVGKDGLSDARRIVVGYEEESREKAVIGVPLRSSGRRLGVLVIARTTRDDFTAYDLKLLRAFGDQASVLLERSLLYEEVEAGAILQERSRLAREIHDGLAQHLAFLKMRVAWLQRSPGALTTDQLKDIEAVLETALIEARHAITTLRSEPQGTSTLDAITAYAEEFAQVSGLDLAVEADDGLPEVGPKTRVELLRVVQESLNNVRKHAQATRVTVAVRYEQGGLGITLHDDGVGFSSDQDRQGHFGLDIMSERAESVGGRLTVSSAPGVGSKVQIWVPGQDTEVEPAPADPLRVAQS